VIRTNLSTRPFYNERAVHFYLLVAALVVVAATVFNVSQARRYRRTDTALATRADQEEARALELERRSARLRASVDPRRIDVAAAAARQANELIDRRMFSWTELLNRLESTLPDDAHIVAIRPKVDRTKGIVLTINIVAHEVDDVDQFMERLEKTGAFRNPRPTNERFNDQGLFEAQLETDYLPASGKPTAEAGAERP
jgi:Tfp pilus assembly protein PilN